MTINHCNSCQQGYAEFIGHHYDDKKNQCFSVYQCVFCGAKHYQLWNPSFDIEHPKAMRGMMPTDDYMRRVKKSWA
jgi:hypothetical protein